MSNFFSTQLASLNAAPPVRVKVNRLNGRIRYAMGLWPATATAPQIADFLYMVRLPVGSRILGHLSQLSWFTGTASETLTVGDTVSTARHLAATAATTAGTATPQAVTSATGADPFETTDGTLSSGVPSATNNCDIGCLVAGAAVAVTQLISLQMAYVQD